MKVLAICGSPRKGNTEWMLNKILENVNDNKELVLLRKLNIKQCTGCGICSETGKECPIDDDMKGLYQKILDCDILILGSPNYFNNVSGLMKKFIDRTDALYPQLKLKGKKAVAVCVGEGGAESTKHCEHSLKEFVRIHQMELIKSIMAQADAPEEIKSDKETENKLIELGKEINKNE